jgi:hypothetical protein
MPGEVSLFASYIPNRAIESEAVELLGEGKRKLTNIPISSVVPFPIKYRCTCTTLQNVPHSMYGDCSLSIPPRLAVIPTPQVSGLNSLLKSLIGCLLCNTLRLGTTLLSHTELLRYQDHWAWVRPKYRAVYACPNLLVPPFTYSSKLPNEAFRGRYRPIAWRVRDLAFG